MTREQIERFFPRDAETIIKVLENRGEGCSKDEIEKFLWCRYRFGRPLLLDRPSEKKTPAGDDDPRSDEFEEEMLFRFHLLGDPGVDARRTKYTICPSYKMRNGKDAGCYEHGFTCLCEYGLAGFCLCYGKSNFADADISEEVAVALCRYCPHYDRNQLTGYYPRKYDNNTVSMPHFIYMNCEKNLYRRTGIAPAYVYFVSDGQFVKIGVAQDPQKRLASLQTGNPRELEIINLIPAKSKEDALVIEGTLHEAYCSFKKAGEWFDILYYINRDAFDELYPPEISKKKK